MTTRFLTTHASTHLAVLLYTDDIAHAHQFLGRTFHWVPLPLRTMPARTGSVASRLFRTKEAFAARVEDVADWEQMFLVKYAPKSQFDILVELASTETPPVNGTVCLAGTGETFHGFNDRPWVTTPGNIHLSAFLSPNTSIKRFDVAFTLLSAVSVVQTLDEFEWLRHRATIRWVNDVLVDGAKISGVIANTQSVGTIVTGAVVGIGLNVESKPAVEPTPFVREVAAVRDSAPPGGEPTRSQILPRLLRRLAENYRVLLDGRQNELLEFYRARSVVLGQEVRVFADTPGDRLTETARGRVESIGDNLELVIRGAAAPVRKGRLIVAPSS